MISLCEKQIKLRLSFKIKFWVNIQSSPVNSQVNSSQWVDRISLITERIICEQNHIP